MRLGIFGGSFDPVHLGHLALAESCLAQVPLDRVRLMPIARQPLKPTGPVARDEDRVTMLRLAIADRTGLDLSTAEVDRGGVSYTVDTLIALHRKEPERELFLLMGADSLADLPQWHEPAEICRLATPVVVNRAGEPPPDFTALEQLLEVENIVGREPVRVTMPPQPISSTEIRQRIASGDPWWTMVPAGVAKYIQEHGLYQGETSA